MRRGRAIADPGARQRPRQDDRRDAKKLVGLYRGGLLRFVHPPTPELEGLRDLLRARDDVRGARLAARNRVLKRTCCATAGSSTRARQPDQRLIDRSRRERVELPRVYSDIAERAEGQTLLGRIGASLERDLGEAGETRWPAGVAIAAGMNWSAKRPWWQRCDLCEARAYAPQRGNTCANPGSRNGPRSGFGQRNEPPPDLAGLRFSFQLRPVGIIASSIRRITKSRRRRPD